MLFLIQIELEAEEDIQIYKDMEIISLEDHLLQWTSKENQPDPRKVLDLDEKLFTTQFRPFLQTPYFTASVWGKCRIKINEKPNEDLFLLISRSFHINLDCYLFDIEKDSIIKLTRDPFISGISHPKFKLPLEKNKIYDVLIHINNAGSIGKHPISIMTNAKISELFLVKNYLRGFFYGIMLIILVLTTLLYLLIKRKEIILYNFYLISSCLYQFTFDGSAYALLFPNNPELNPVLLSILVNFSFYLGINFFNSFLKPKYSGTVLRKIGWLMSSYFLFVIPLTFFEETNRYLIFINNFTALAGITYLVIASIVVYRKISYSKYFLIGYVFLLVGIVTQIISNIGFGAQENLMSYSLKLGLIFEFLLLAVGLINLWLIQMRANNKKAILAVEKLHQSKMLFLSNRLNPHFIFNALTSLQNFVLTEESVKASRYISRFSKLLRSIFDNSAQSMVSLESELKHLELYVSMESVRTNEQFSFSTSVDPKINPSNTMIPTMLIQPFIENSIWHGIRDITEKGKIELDINISKDDFLLVKIRDNGIGRNQASRKNSKKKHKPGGLHLTRQRINIHNNWREDNASIKINDLIDKDNNSYGTEVIFQLKLITK